MQDYVHVLLISSGRSSRPEVFLRKGVLKICHKFTGEHPCKQLYWNRTSAWVFSCKFAAYFQNTFSQEHLWVAAFAVVINQIQFTIFIPTRTVTVIDYSDIINLLQVLVFLAKMSDKDLNKIYQIYQKERRLKKMIC